MSFVMAQYVFPLHMNVFIITQRVFFRIERCQPIIRVENNIQESLPFTCSSHRISVLLRLRRDFVVRRLVRKQGIYICSNQS